MLPSVSTFDDFLYALSPRDSFKFSCTVGSEQLIQAWVLENATSSSQTGRYNFDINSPLNDEGETCLHLVLKALHVDHNRDGSKMLFNYTIDSEEVLAEVERRTALGEEEQIYTIQHLVEAGMLARRPTRGRRPTAMGAPSACTSASRRVARRWPT